MLLVHASDVQKSRTVRITKITVYLPEDLMHALERLAASQGRTEAAVIRDVIAAAVLAQDRPRGPHRLWAALSIAARGRIAVRRAPVVSAVSH